VWRSNNFTQGEIAAASIQFFSYRSIHSNLCQSSVYERCDVVTSLAGCCCELVGLRRSAAVASLVLLSVPETANVTVRAVFHFAGL
jgi:hypothetical protein